MYQGLEEADDTQKAVDVGQASSRRGPWIDAAGADMRGEGWRVIGLVEGAEDVVHYLVSVLLLMVVAVVVLVHGRRDFIESSGHTFAERVTLIMNNVIIVMSSCRRLVQLKR